MTDAIFTRNKDHCHGRNPGDLLRVLSCEAGQVFRCQTRRPCRFTDGGLQFWVGLSGFRVFRQVAAGLDVFCNIRRCKSLLNVLPHAINLRNFEDA